MLKYIYLKKKRFIHALNNIIDEALHTLDIYSHQLHEGASLKLSEYAELFTTCPKV